MSGNSYTTWELVCYIVPSVLATRSLEKHVELVEASIIFWAKLFGHEGADRFSDFLSLVCAKATNIDKLLTLRTTVNTMTIDAASAPSVDRVLAAYRQQATSMATAHLSSYVKYMLKANFYSH